VIIIIKTMRVVRQYKVVEINKYLKRVLIIYLLIVVEIKINQKLLIIINQ
jgi:hypothetical protein